MIKDCVKTTAISSTSIVYLHYHQLWNVNTIDNIYCDMQLTTEICFRNIHDCEYHRQLGQLCQRTNTIYMIFIITRSKPSIEGRALIQTAVSSTTRTSLCNGQK